MGTNYYFTPKCFERLNEVNKITYMALNEIRDNYIHTVEDIIKTAENQHNCYKTLLNIDKDKLNETRIELEYEFDLPEIHICKISMGWKVLFEANDSYSNLDEFKSFYEKYKEDFIITDEYSREFTLDEFINEVISHNNSKNSKNSHLQYSCSYFKYYKDDYGIEWVNQHFE